jgi:starvation-inducible DNA-binding protein
MESLFKLLSDTQASLLVLFHKTWVYHWNVVGSDFQQLHTLFGEQYETIFEEIDRLTENMRYLNMRPVSTLTRVVEVTEVSEAQSGVDAEGMIEDLLQSNMKICELLSKVSEEAGNQKQNATSNIADDLAETHGKFVWMLRSFKS